MAYVPETSPRALIPRTSTRSSRSKLHGVVAGPSPVTRTRATEPPRKKLRYTPGSPGAEDKLFDEEEIQTQPGGIGRDQSVGPESPLARDDQLNGVAPRRYERRERLQRPRTVVPQIQQPAMRFSSSSQAAAVVQNDGYKPREERAWEEFHPNLDIEASLRAFSSDEVEGIKPGPSTPISTPLSAGFSTAVSTPATTNGSGIKREVASTPVASVAGEASTFISIPGTPGGGRRRPGRPPKDPVAFAIKKAAEKGLYVNLGTPKAPKLIIPTSSVIQNTTAKERLTLPQPSYRQSDTLARFEKKPFATFVDQSMINVGYQTTDTFSRYDNVLIKVDPNLEQDLDTFGFKSGGETFPTIGSGGVGRVEYDMDEQDDNWLGRYNEGRLASGADKITREIFEITITKIEKEWHSLERRIPKPNPKPPQTQRPRSSSAAAVNGEPQAGEEQDSKCAICDDGDCENTNAIVFCDGCDLAVHQECYGVPFIPEGQWLCRKCQLIGRGVPTCIFCPNTDGAFKQTNSSKWAHLLCAMWIPEVSLGNHTFMEPVMEVEKVPKTRWKLSCYLCNQRMGACIQCGNKSCYQAFHVTCARKAHLFLKMKNNHGTLAVLDGNTVLKAFCDKHCPPEYSKENDVAGATREARAFYKKTMRGRLWADSQASALAMAATHRHAVTEHQPDESQLTGAKLAMTLSENKKKGNQPVKQIWKLPSGAPVIPQVVFNSVESSLQRFNILKRKEYAADACRYWTLKREARRGAALLKRLQLQMETFSSMEITRRNFAGMGPAGRPRLARRIEFAQNLILELEALRELAYEKEKQEADKLTKVQVDQDIINQVYFPVVRSLSKVVLKLESYGGQGMELFKAPLSKLHQKVDMRFYTTTEPFLKDLKVLIGEVISTEPVAKLDSLEPALPVKKPTLGLKERRTLAKRIIKSAQKLLNDAIDQDANYAGQSVQAARNELASLLEANFPIRTESAVVSPLVGSGSHHDGDSDERGVIQDGVVEVPVDAMTNQDSSQDISMDIGTTGENNIVEQLKAPSQAGDMMIIDSEQAKDDIVGDKIIAALVEFTGNTSSPLKMNGSKNSDTPPGTNGYTAPEIEHEQEGPPTPPISNKDINVDQARNILIDGGVPPFLLQDFEIDGTRISEKESSKRKAEDSLSDVLSDMDDDLVDGLQAGVMSGDGVAIATASAAKVAATKKGKAKARKKRR